MCSNCPSCDLKVESDSNALQCRKCEKWIHYFCTQLPSYFIVLLAGSTITFICETCVSLRFEKDFVSRHLEVEEAVTAVKLLRAGATPTDQQTTPEKVVQDPPNPLNSQPQTSPVIVNETSDHQSGLSRSKPVDVKSVCHFHLQGRCKHGRSGTGCKYSHPNLCKKFILKGERGCSNGDKCRFTHPRLCVGSLKNNTCHRKKCFLYHVTGSSRPNLPKNNREIGKLKSTHVQDRINSTSEPITSKNSTKQTYAEVVNGSSSFLDQLNEMKSQIQSLLIMQRQVMQCVFPQMWSTTQNQDRQNWAHLPGQPMQGKFAQPPTLW